MDVLTERREQRRHLLAHARSEGRHEILGKEHRGEAAPRRLFPAPAKSGERQIEAVPEDGVELLGQTAQVRHGQGGRIPELGARVFNDAVDRRTEPFDQPAGRKARIGLETGSLGNRRPGLG